MSNINYYLRIGRWTQELKSLEKNPSCYYGFVIPANILAYYKTSLSTFISNIKKPFFIDPQTYIFSLPSCSDVITRTVEIEKDGKIIKEVNLKKSYGKLLDYYSDSENLKSKLINGPLKSSYFSDKKILDFITKSFDIQENILLMESKKSSISKYDEIYKEASGEKKENKKSEREIQPKFLVLPYFFAEDYSSEWFEINLKIFKLGKKIDRNLDKYAVVYLNKNLLKKSENVDTIISELKGYDGYIIFISEFNEWTVSKAELQLFIKFIQKLYGSYKKPIINLYSTTFSSFLKSVSLKGFCTGLNINNFKNTDNIGFGRVMFRFYLPSLHKILNQSESMNFFRDFNPLNECKCDLCAHISNRRTNDKKSDRILIDKLFKNKEWLKFATRESQNHFLINIKKEVDFANKNVIKDYVKKLDENIKFTDDYDFVNKNYLTRWKEVLDDINI